MPRLQAEPEVPLDRVGQGFQQGHRDVDHPGAAGALQVGMAARGPLRQLQVQVVDRRRAAQVGVGDQAEPAEGGQRSIDAGPVQAWRQVLRPKSTLTP